jgi:WD40 repeat protein
LQQITWFKFINAELIAVISGKNKLQLWNINAGKLVKEKVLAINYKTCLFKDFNNTIILVDELNTIRVIDAMTFENKLEIKSSIEIKKLCNSSLDEIQFISKDSMLYNVTLSGIFSNVYSKGGLTHKPIKTYIAAFLNDSNNLVFPRHDLLYFKSDKKPVGFTDLGNYPIRNLQIKDSLIIGVTNEPKIFSKRLNVGQFTGLVWKENFGFIRDIILVDENRIAVSFANGKIRIYNTDVDELYNQLLSILTPDELEIFNKYEH